MKKLTTLIALLLVTISLTACNSGNEPFKLTNFSIQQITTIFNEKTQYDSEYNADSTNQTLFTVVKEAIGEYDVVMFNNTDDINANENQVYINVHTNNGNLEIYKAIYNVDGEDQEVTIILFNADSAAYASIDMYDDILELI